MTAYRWSGPLASYDKATGDRRVIDSGALTSRNTPLPLRYGLLGTHDPAISVGAISTINMATNPVTGTGVFLPMDVEPMVKVAMVKAAMGIAQPSVDLEPGTMEMAIGDHGGKRVLRISKAHVMGATLVSFPAFADQPLDVSMDPDAQLPMPFESLVASAAEAMGWTIEEIPDEEAIALVAACDPYPVNYFSVRSGWGSMPIAKSDPSWDAGAALRALDTWAGDDMGKYATAFLWKDSAGDPKEKGSYKFPIAMPIGGTLTIIPAAVRAAASRVSGANIPTADKKTMQAVIHGLMMKISGGAGSKAETMYDDGLVAGGGPLAPSIHDFADPKLTKPTPVTITPDGRIFGHIAQWNVCHTGVGNSCVLAPHSKTNYQKFHQGTVITSEGEAIRVGKITLGAGHADTKLGLIPASEHYDNTATAVAVVCAGEDQFGAWCAGTLLSGLSNERIAELRRSPLSGDWRLDRSVDNLELIAALAVNSPGFPIFEIVAGAQISLVAAGMVITDVVAETFESANEDASQEERKAKLAALTAADEVRAQAQRAARLAALSGGEK